MKQSVHPISECLRLSPKNPYILANSIELFARNSFVVLAHQPVVPHLMTVLKIVHFSDILCVWAYIGQSNLQKLTDEFGPGIKVETRFCSVFPNAQGKIEKMWSDRGGFDGYADHVRQVVEGFPTTELHVDVWTRTRPKSSASPHLFVKALELVKSDDDEGPPERSIALEATRELRSAFFVKGEDVSDWVIQKQISRRLSVDFDEIRSKIETGEAIARLAGDYELAQSMNVRGSPTYILNDGRQILFGNVSYAILKANVSELLSEQQDLNATPC